MIKIGINGFGRIGRIALRIIEEKRLLGNNIQIVAINTRKSKPDFLAFQLKHDSIHGKFKGNITNTEDSIIVNDREIKCFNFNSPEFIPWNTVGVDIVLECSGVFTTIDSAKGHITAGAKKVIISAPSKDAPMFVYGVNVYKYNNETIISNSSCTTNCLAPIIKILNDAIGVKNGLLTTIHSITSSQNTVDGSSSKKNDWRICRSALNNIIPTTTGAAKAIGKIIPELNNKLTGISVRVPTTNVSLVDITLNLNKNTSYDEIINIIKIASQNQFKNIVSLSYEPLVSNDYIGNPHSCIIDIKSSILLQNNFLKLICWYDNEWGYTNRLVDLIFKIY